MLSTPLRQLWVDCVTLCHVLGAGLSGSSKISTTTFIRKMMQVAGTHPRAQKSAGGVRIAALHVISSLLQQDALAPSLAPWSLDVLQLTLRALKSAGNGEPTYRHAAVQAACATAEASRWAYWKMHSQNHSSQSLSSSSISSPGSTTAVPPFSRSALVMQGAWEDRAIHEAIKVVKQAATDKFPEVRSAAAQLVSVMAPLLIHHASHGTSSSSGPDVTTHRLASLDDIFHVALRNIDDESPYCADSWAQAAARCMCTALELVQSSARVARGDLDEPGAGKVAGGRPTEGGGRGGGSVGRRQGQGGIGQHCSTLRSCLQF